MVGGKVNHTLPGQTAEDSGATARGRVGFRDWEEQSWGVAVQSPRAGHQTKATQSEGEPSCG